MCLGHAPCGNNKTTRANYHNIYFCIGMVHESRSQFGAHEMGNCVASTRPIWMCEGGCSGEKIMWKFAARFSLFGRSSLARVSHTTPAYTQPSRTPHVVRKQESCCVRRDIVWTLFSSWVELSPPLNKFRSDTDSLRSRSQLSKLVHALAVLSRAFLCCAFSHTPAAGATPFTLKLTF